MNETVNSVGPAWARLRSEGGGGEGLEIPSLSLDVETREGPIRVAIGDSGEPRLLIPIGFRDRMPDVKTGDGLSVQEITLGVSGRQSRFIDLECENSALEKVFSEFADEIVRRIADGEAAGRAIESTFRDFRDLLLRAGRQEISRETAGALLAELLVLGKLIATDPAAWQSWTGPDGNRHDFTAGTLALEVKSGVRKHQPVVEISALDQLLEPEGGQLHLVHILLEPIPKGKFSVPEVASELTEKVDDAGGFRQKLLEAEFDPEQPEAWEEHRFSVLADDMYRVTEGFPRLVPRNFEPDKLPAGISRLRYRLDLSAAAEFRLDEAEAEGVLIDFCSQR